VITARGAADIRRSSMTSSKVAIQVALVTAGFGVAA
jgi:hypothetical protein